jgi:hypothetical protein
MQTSWKVVDHDFCNATLSLIAYVMEHQVNQLFVNDDLVGDRKESDL